MGQIDGAVSRVIERNRTNILQLLFVLVVAERDVAELDLPAP